LKTKMSLKINENNFKMKYLRFDIL